MIRSTLCLFIAGFILTPGFAQPSPNVVTGQLLVQRRIGATDDAARKAFQSHGAKEKRRIDQLQIHVIQVPESALERVKDALSKTGLFTFAERDGRGKADAMPNDPNVASQWHLYKIAASDAWLTTTGSSSTPIAVLDTGVDSTHPDLAGKVLSGWNYVMGNSNTLDTHGHGTKVAGSAAAITNNALGVAGVAWLNPILPVVVADSTGYVDYSNIASGITYAADRGARIINVSISGSTSSSTLQSAVNYAWNKGALVVAAAGNSSTSAPYYPAACDKVLAIGATDSADARASYSNYGTWVDVVAPGSSILTTLMGGSYGSASGTSFASPVTAGVAALVWGVRPAATPEFVTSMITQNADDLGAAGPDVYFGSGRVNASKAVAGALAFTADIQPPKVSITNPLTGTVLVGTVAVQGTALDNGSVRTVELYVDGVASSSTSAASFNFSWDTRAVPNGVHALRIRAIDAAGNAGESSVSVSVNNQVVADTTPPNARISSPSNGSVLTKNVTVKASASDNVAVTQTIIELDGVQVAACSGSSCSFAWSVRKGSKGNHTVGAVSFDAAGNRGSAPVVVVEVR